MTVSDERPVARRNLGVGLLRIYGIYLAWFGVLTIGAFAAGGYWLLPRLIQTQGLPLVNQYLAGSLAAQHASVNPFTFELHLQGLEVKDGYGDLLASAADLMLDLDAWALWSGEIRFERIHLIGPWLNIIREEGGGINLARLFRDADQGTPAVAAPYRLDVADLAVVNGVARVTDNRDLTPATTTLLPISFTVRDLTSEPDAPGSDALQIGFADGGTLFWQGTVSLRPVRAAGELRISNLSAVLPWRFLRDELAIAEPRGRLELAASYQFEWRDARPALTISDLQAELSGLALQRHDAPQPFLQIARVRLRDGRYRLTDNAFSAAELQVDQASASVVQRDGNVDWQTIIAPDPTRSRFTSGSQRLRPFSYAIERVGLTDVTLRLENHDQPRPLQFTLDGVDGACRFLAERTSSDENLQFDRLQLSAAAGGLRQQGAAEALLALHGMHLNQGRIDLIQRHVDLGEVTIEGGQGSLQLLAGGVTNWHGVWRSTEATKSGPLGAAPWRVDLQRGFIQQLAFEFLDRNPQPPVTLALDPVKLTVSEFAYPLVQPLRFDLLATASVGGEIAAAGKVQLDTGSLEATLAINELPLRPLASYLTSQVKVDMARGSLSARGSIGYGKEVSGGLRFAGRTQIRRLELRESGGAMLLGWQHLIAPRLTVQLQPPQVDVPSLELERPTIAWRIGEDGASNWQGLRVERAKVQAAPGGESSHGALPVDIDIGRVRIADGQLEFTNARPQPPFTGKWHGLNGSITGISTASPDAMAVALRGHVGQQGTLEIQGRADPFDPAHYSTFDMRYQNIDMVGLSPYSAKFAGQWIEAGTLSLDLSYRVEDQQLAGDHRMLVDGLVMGEQADGQDAANVPLQLAIALWQDSKGQIALKFPVTGDLSDPQFDYARVLWQALDRRLARTATSPFRALATRLGVPAKGLSEILFATGRSEVAPREREKLMRTAGLLKGRPRLQLIVRSGFAPGEDASALRMQAVNRALAERLDVSTLPIDGAQRIAFEDPKIRQALRGLFTRRRGAQAWTQANSRILPDEAPQIRYTRLHALLAASEDLPKNALKQLAIKRARAIVEVLTGEGQIAPTRVRREAPVETAVATEGDRLFAVVELDLAPAD